MPICRWQSADSAWLSVHLHTEANRNVYGPDGDFMLLNYLVPVVEKCRAAGMIHRFFFIRYGENGPHLRLRISADADALRGFVKPAILQQMVQPPVRAVGSEYGTQAPPILKRLDWIPYEPEFQRYGGHEAQAVAEEVFHVSSIAAIALVSATDGNRSRLLGQGLLAQLILTKSFLQDRRRMFTFARSFQHSFVDTLARTTGTARQEWDGLLTDSSRRQNERLTRFVQEALGRIDQKVSLTPILDRFRDSIETCVRALSELHARRRITLGGSETRSWNECVHWLLPSYIHMMNNRLGLPTLDEAHMSRLLYDALVADPAEVSEGSS
jgi:thiopeptide-type bacteriocin biosynthesis protein